MLDRSARRMTEYQMALVEGDQIPDLTLEASDGSVIALRDMIGQPFVLYFYPKDDTTGCTREAQDFSVLLPEFSALGVKILGVSKDSAARHQKFAAKYDLSVPLATDAENAVMLAFGSWVEKQLYGRRYMGVDRSTFLFASDGTLARVWRKVRVAGHAEAVLAAAKELTAK